MESKNTSPLKRLWDALGSLKFFWWLCMLISFVFYFGVMGIKGGAVHGFKEMNKWILIDWVTVHGAEKPLILGWLFIVTVLVFLLTVNLTARLSSEIQTVRRLYLDWKEKDAKGSGVILVRKGAVFLMHVSVFLMIFIHLASAVSGVKYSGPVLMKGRVIDDPRLPFPVECVDIIKPGGKNQGKHARPTVVLKPAASDLPAFNIPGWYKGYYYNLYADYIQTEPETGKPGDAGKKPRKKIGLKLTVNNLHVAYPLLAAACLCLLGVVMHIFTRPEVIDFLAAYKKRLQPLSGQ